MVLAGLLERSEASGEGYRFTVKGGVALELRLKDRARATKDIDLVLHHADADLARAFERAVTTGGASNQGFQFRRKGEPLHLENRTISVEFAVTYEGGAWTSIVVDVARAEPGEGDVELVPAIPLREATGISGPTELACLPLRMHIAQKLHGMTLPPRRGKRNERFKDLIDVLLMAPLVTDYAGLREGCESVFRTRGTHEWPPVLEVPMHWVEPFAEVARDLDLPVRDAHEAIERVRAFVDRIRTA
jgi:Nucleotidyl transferase AbiEii toxin, Type IV TA system